MKKDHDLFMAVEGQEDLVVRFTRNGQWDSGQTDFTPRSHLPPEIVEGMLDPLRKIFPDARIVKRSSVTTST